MSRLSDLANKAKHLVVEDDEAPKAPAVPHIPAPVPHEAFNVPMPMSTGGGAAAVPASSPFEMGTTPVLDEKVYQTVRAKTSFDTTPVGKTIHGYYDGLDGMDPGTKFKTAFRLASKRDGVAAAQVLAAYDQLQAALDKDAQDFQRIADGVQADQITARQTKIAQIDQQISALTAQKAQLSSELMSETARHSNAVTQHGLAQQRRAGELAAEKADVTTLLRMPGSL